MVYIVTDSKENGKVVLVKCEDRGEIEKRLILSPTQEISGTLTDNEVSVLTTSNFVVITA